MTVLHINKTFQELLFTLTKKLMEKEFLTDVCLFFINILRGNTILNMKLKVLELYD